MQHDQNVLLKLISAIDAGADVEQQSEDLQLRRFVEKVYHVDWDRHEVVSEDLPRYLFGDLSETPNALLNQVDVAHRRRCFNRFFQCLCDAKLKQVVDVIRANVQHLDEGLDGGEFDFTLDLLNRLLV